MLWCCCLACKLAHEKLLCWDAQLVSSLVNLLCQPTAASSTACQIPMPFCPAQRAVVAPTWQQLHQRSQQVKQRQYAVMQTCASTAQLIYLNMHTFGNSGRSRHLQRAPTTGILTADWRFWPTIYSLKGTSSTPSNLLPPAKLSSLNLQEAE